MKPELTVVLGLIAILVVSGCVTSPDPLNPELSVSIDEQDRACVTDDDCTSFDPTCSFCHCGEPINKQNVDKYMQLRTELCQGYAGGVCDMACPPQEISCVENACAFVPVHMGLRAFETALEDFELLGEKPTILTDTSHIAGETDGVITAIWRGADITINIISHATEAEANDRLEDMKSSFETGDNKTWTEIIVDGETITRTGSYAKNYVWTHGKYYFMINLINSPYFQELAEKVISIYKQA
jgi:hypothetical protein